MENTTTEYSVSDFEYLGSIQLVSGNVLISDPSYLSSLRKSEISEDDEFADFNPEYISEEIESSELTVGIQAPDGWAAGFACEPGYLNVFGKYSNEFTGRIAALIFSTVTTNVAWKEKLLLEDLHYEYESFYEVDGITIDSGQLLICDASYLSEYDSNSLESWDLEKNAGKFSYQGASEVTIANGFGVIGGDKGFVSNTGFGDGSYSVFAIENMEEECGAILIEFIK